MDQENLTRLPFSIWEVTRVSTLRKFRKEPNHFIHCPHISTSLRYKTYIYPGKEVCDKTEYYACSDSFSSVTLVADCLLKARRYKLRVSALFSVPGLIVNKVKLLVKMLKHEERDAVSFMKTFQGHPLPQGPRTLEC